MQECSGIHHSRTELYDSVRNVGGLRLSKEVEAALIYVAKRWRPGQAVARAVAQVALEYGFDHVWDSRHYRAAEGFLAAVLARSGP